MASTAQYRYKWGDPGTPTTPNVGWLKLNLVSVALPWAMVNAMDTSQQITHCLFHRLAAPLLTAALSDVWDAAQENCKLHPGLSTRDNLHSFGGDLWDGTFNLRFVRGYEAQGILSPHSFGIAIDINGAGNPMGIAKTTFPTWFIECFKRHGFVWGGDFHSRKDCMHFEVATP